MIVDDTDDDDRVLYSGVLLKKRKVFWKEADCVLRKKSFTYCYSTLGKMSEKIIPIDKITGLFIIRSKTGTERDLMRIESTVEDVLLKDAYDAVFTMTKWLKLLRIVLRGDGNLCAFKQVEKDPQHAADCQEHKAALAAAGRQLFVSNQPQRPSTTDKTLADAGKQLFTSRFARQTKRHDVDDRDQTSQLTSLKAQSLEQLTQHLPWSLREKPLSLLYRMSEHGASITTLYEFVRNRGPTIMVIHTTTSQIIGAFASVSWIDSRNRYYGTGRTFLFRRNDHPSSSSSTALRVYEWTKQNTYFMVSSHEFLALGGGGAFGLYLNADFSTCHSDTSPTFNNEPLVDGRSFECKELEIYGFSQIP